jgi:DNA-binding NarL/FixJ family response regulator
MHLADLGSRNGTFIGNRRISSLRPNSQNRVRLGAVSLVFRPVPRFDPTQEEDVEESILSEALVRRRKGRRIDSTLTRPQQEVLQLTNQGLSEEEIANLLGRSYHTVHNHLKAIFKHFGVHSKLKLLAIIKEDFE